MSRVEKSEDVAEKIRPAETYALLELCSRGRVGRVGWTAAEVSVTSTSIGTLVLQLYWDTIRLVGRRNKGTTGTSTVWEKIARVMAQTILCLAVVQW